jgi:uncharacterized membrane protein
VSQRTNRLTNQQTDKLVAGQTTNKSPQPPSPTPPLPLPRLPSILCLQLIIIFAIFFCVLAVQQHRTFQTNGLDLGNVDQALWNTAHGRFLHFTLMTPVQSRLSLHVEPILLFLVPLYWLNLGGPEMLLIIQVSVVALGAWPLYQIANSKFQFTIHNSQFTTSHFQTSLVAFLGLIFPLAYLPLPALQSAVLFDFHAVTLAPTFFLFAFWAMEQKKDRQFIIFLLLAMACKEDMPLVVAMIGLYVGLAHRRWRLAGLVIGLSIVWFVLAVFVIQPHFAVGGNIQLERYAWLGHSPVEMAQTILTQPSLVFNHLWHQANLPGYLTQLFFPTAFLALLSPLTLLPMLPTLAVNLFSDNPFTWRLEDFHYGAPLAPFLFISAIYGMAWLVRRLGDWEIGKTDALSKKSPPPFSPSPPLLILLLCVLLLTFTAIYHIYHGFTPLARSFIWPRLTAHHRQLEDVLQTIPPDTALFTQSNLAPHLTHRPVIYSDFGYFTDSDFPAPAPVDDILLDVTTFENIGGLHQFLRQTLLESGDYEVVTARDGILHLRPPTTDSQFLPPTPYSLLPTPFYTFTQPDTLPDHQLPLDFGDVIRLHGYSLHFNRQEEVQVTVDLEPLQPLARDMQPVLYLLNATGHVTGATTDLQPTLVWFPPDQWPVGETVRVHFNTLPWYTRETETYGLALGVISGPDVWDVSRRRRPTITQPNEFITRLPADGTLVELAQIGQVWGMPEGGPVVRQYTAPRLPHSLDANFADQIKLLGHTMPKIADTGEAQSLTLTLYWQAVNTPENLTRFVQFVGPDGQIYGQNDSIPDYGNYPIHLWQPSEVVAETVTLPIQTERPAGNYTLHIGLYRTDTGQRLPLISGSDHVEIPVGW